MNLRDIKDLITIGKHRVEKGEVTQSEYQQALEAICGQHGFAEVARELDQAIKDSGEHLQTVRVSWQAMKPTLEDRLHLLIAKFIASDPEASTYFGLIVGMEKAVSEHNQLQLVRKELHRAYQEQINSQVEVNNAG